MKKRIVLDSNAVMDWLVFGDASMRGIEASIRTGYVTWLISDALQGELLHVLGRGVAAAWRPDVTAILATISRHTERVPQPTMNGAPHRLRCTDADDQKFLDLALAHRAHWLVTRDRALLKLARRAAPLGLAIVTPAHWRLVAA